MLWWKLPIFRLLCCFLIGIGSFYVFPNPDSNRILVQAIGLFAILLIAILGVYSTKSYFIIHFLSFFLLGLLSNRFSDSNPSSGLLEEIAGSSSKLCLIKKIEKDKSIATLIGYSSERQSLAVEANVQIAHAGKIPDWQPGDTVFVSQPFRQIQSPLNEWEFDYRKFMARKNIFWTCTYRPRQFNHDDNSVAIGFRFNMERWRQSLIQKIRWKLDDEKLSSLLVALIWGDKSYLSNDQIMAFRKSGTAHLIALSGMHVGLVFLLLGKILSVIKTTKLYYPLLISAICCYAMFGGMSSSVFRAALMLSFVLIGRQLGRNPGTVHWYVLAIFCMLVVDVEQIEDVGFQLSCVAVAGILLFFDRFKTILSRIGIRKSFMRDPLALCFAAQLATAPLSIYYFHQFQVLFPLGNLLLAPLVGILMILGVGIQVLPKGAFLDASQFGALQIQTIMGKILDFINDFEWCYLENVSLTMFQMILAYVGLFFINMGMIRNWKIWQWTHYLAFVLLVIQLEHKSKFWRDDFSIQSLNFPEGKALILEGKGKAIMYSKVQLDYEKMNKHVLPYLWEQGLKKENFQVFQDQNWVQINHLN
jgi:competence protein ComEC